MTSRQFAGQLSLSIAEAQKTGDIARANEGDARRAMWAAESLGQQSRQDVTTRTAEYKDTIRAIINRSEDGVYRERLKPERIGQQRLHRSAYRTTFAHGEVFAEPAKWNSPEGAPLHAHSFVHSAYSYRENTMPIYNEDITPGTSNPEKLQKQLDQADALIIAFLESHTAAAFLRARGLEPTQSYDLRDWVAVRVSITNSHYNKELYWGSEWVITSADGSVILDTVNRFEPFLRLVIDSLSKEENEERYKSKELTETWADAIAPNVLESWINARQTLYAYDYRL